MPSARAITEVAEYWLPGKIWNVTSAPSILNVSCYELFCILQILSMQSMRAQREIVPTKRSPTLVVTYFLRFIILNVNPDTWNQSLAQLIRCNDAIKFWEK